MDAGIIPVEKVSRRSDGSLAAEALGPYDFKTKQGHKVTLNVTAVAGTPCVTLVDGTGKRHYQPLKLRQVIKTKRKIRTQVATLWSIPDKGIVPPHLVAARVRIRHTRTASEREAGKSRSPQAHRRRPDPLVRAAHNRHRETSRLSRVAPSEPAKAPGKRTSAHLPTV